ncbi:MAG TPA: hypothetical protein PLJ71_22535 [Candidatus Hydrogenedentes bacterium]|nr:hypothetical protein [Candidatus Hydrogenedentota bacterium]
MRKLLAGTVLAVTVFIVWRLVSGRPGTAADEVKRMPAGEAREAAAEVGRAVAEEARLSRLGAAYAPGVVVLTNAVLAFDPRKRVKVPSEEWSRYQAEKHGVSKLGGPKAKVTFHVVDEDGNNVTNAAVSVNLAVNGVKPTTGGTDCDGLFAAEGRLSEELIYSVTKDGFYKTRSKFAFGGLGIISMEDGCRIPWNPTVRVTLKQIRNPIRMYARRLEVTLPADTNSLGFDFLAGDWVGPYGKGTHADMVYTYDEKRGGRSNYDLTITLSFPGEGNGFYMRKKDKFSALVSDQVAALSGYRPEGALRLHRVEGKYLCEERIADDDYLVFRVGNGREESGGAKMAYYGKMYGPLEVPHAWTRKFTMTYYFNPTPNDRNIEYAPRNNLFKGLKSYEDVYEP